MVITLTTERIFGMLSHFGYEPTSDEYEADLLIVNKKTKKGSTKWYFLHVIQIILFHLFLMFPLYL